MYWRGGNNQRCSRSILYLWTMYVLVKGSERSKHIQINDTLLIIVPHNGRLSWEHVETRRVQHKFCGFQKLIGLMSTMDPFVVGWDTYYALPLSVRRSHPRSCDPAKASFCKTVNQVQTYTEPAASGYYQTKAETSMSLVSLNPYSEGTLSYGVASERVRIFSAGC